MVCRRFFEGPFQTAPVNRTCTIDIPFNNATFWDTYVAASFQGEFNDVATDTTNGIYASGVAASPPIQSHPVM